MVFGYRAIEKENHSIMRKRVLLTLICALSLIMAMAQRTNPDVADYYIKGNLSIEKGIDGKPVYKLSVTDNQGISFENPRATREGRENEKEENVLFQFRRASTNYSGDINTELNFWRYDESIREWQPDGETRQGTAGMEDKKSMVVMLVLDCSKSIGGDFVAVQEAAKAFIQSLYSASDGVGNIKLGIVSFSKINETQFFNIRPLTTDSYHETTRFINSLSIQNGTALYYAMDKSVELMEDYCKNSISSAEPLSAAVMVTFTDGLDQTSRDPDKDILTADNYYDKVLNKYGTKMQKVIINGISLQHEIRGVKGNDIITDKQLGKFERVGESLGNFKLLKDYSELGAAFADIAQNLIDQWRILNLYVPNSFSGRVAWTYPSKKQYDRPNPLPNPNDDVTGVGQSQKGKFFFGINAGFGISKYKGIKGIEYNYHNWQGTFWDVRNDEFEDSSITTTFGLDFAFPIGNAVNLGLFTSIGYDGVGEDKLIFEAGPLLLFNFRKGGALYLGSGLFYGTAIGNYYEPDVFAPNIRLGYKFRNGLYLFGEYNPYKGHKFVANPDHWEGKVKQCDVEGNSYLFHIGYGF